MGRPNIYSFTGSGWIDSGVDYELDTWQQYDVTIDLTRGDVMLQVGESFGNHSIGHPGSVDRIEIEAGWGGTGFPPNDYFVDDVSDTTIVQYTWT